MRSVLKPNRRAETTALCGLIQNGKQIADAMRQHLEDVPEKHRPFIRGLLAQFDFDWAEYGKALAARSDEMSRSKRGSARRAEAAE